MYAADEFYRNAYRADTALLVPPAEHYGDFSLFEDGIGIIRSYVDEFDRACAEGSRRAPPLSSPIPARACALRRGGRHAALPRRMIAESPLAGIVEPLTVENAYFGGNVDVTGFCARATSSRRCARARGRIRGGACSWCRASCSTTTA